jgi:hypothetical protein
VTPEQPGAPDVWARQARITRQLAAWSLGSIAVGTVTAAAGHRAGNPAARAFGMQTAAWGAVDLGIATFGELRRRGRLATAEDAYADATLEAERTSLRRILLVNAGFDVGYIAAGAAGVAWALRRPADPGPHATAGHGAAVVAQGAFLLGFDSWHARALRAPEVRS